MSQSSHGEAPVYLGPKAGKPVQKPGDFIFLREAAFPVRVIVNGDPVTMEAGEKRRFDRSLGNPNIPAFDTFEIENTANFAQRVVFVVGTGDYEKIIVSGEMSVSAFVKTATMGEALSLPMKLEREVGIESLAEQTFTTGTVVWDGGDNDIPGEGACVWWDGKFHTFDEDGMRRAFSPTSAAGVYDSETTWFEPSGDLLGGTITPDGWVYMRGLNNLYRMHISESQPTEIAVPGDNFLGWQGGISGGMHYYQGRIYTLNRFEDITSCDLEGGDWRVETNASVSGELTGFGDLLWNGANQVFKISPSGVVERRADLDRIVVTQGVFSGDGLYQAKIQSGYGYRVCEASTVTTYGQLYVQPVGEAARRKVITLFEKPLTYPYAGETAVVRDWIEDILGGAGYLDFLTKYRYDAGPYEKEIGAGTESFALRGLSVDPFPVLDGATVSIELLPEFFG
ncbi:hypothetical protein [uncultured Microbulbifer sp.]|uniref:hypothetical protein n=1 Tax=uncultured Microbulbifer sp. TaxID=348147 RepID=UPI002622DC32|nr:hypothetical protein [uncultured Microbulbifer sp.]